MRKVRGEGNKKQNKNKNKISGQLQDPFLCFKVNFLVYTFL